MTRPHQRYALDFAFYSSMGVYDFAAQCGMMKEIGYDGIHFSVWDGRRWGTTRGLAEVTARHGIELSGIYIVLNLELDAEHPANAGILTMLEQLEGCTTVNLAIRSAAPGLATGAPAGDEPVVAPVVAFLAAALDICERRGIDLLLYPHIGFWMDRHEVALRLCRHLEHPRLGIVFTGYHWYALEAGDPAPILDALRPWLRQVHLSGSRKSSLGSGGVATIEPLDTGELDNLALIGSLRARSYQGPIGYLGQQEGGNPYNKLKRSFDALNEMIGLAERHPDWFRHIGGPDHV